VYLYLSGETSATDRFSNLVSGSKPASARRKTLLKQGVVILILMQATNGLGVILENRYYGTSYPFNTSTTDNLRYLTTEQSV
jgi:Serine carboxypeptidase S28